MTIDNHKTDIDIDQILINTLEDIVVINKNNLTGESLEKYLAFTNRFGDKKYNVVNTSEIEFNRFTNLDVEDTVETLDFENLSSEDVAIINNFLTLLS